MVGFSTIIGKKVNIEYIKLLDDGRQDLLKKESALADSKLQTIGNRYIIRETLGQGGWVSYIERQTD